MQVTEESELRLIERQQPWGSFWMPFDALMIELDTASATYIVCSYYSIERAMLDALMVIRASP